MTRIHIRAMAMGPVLATLLAGGLSLAADDSAFGRADGLNWLAGLGTGSVTAARQALLEAGFEPVPGSQSCTFSRNTAGSRQQLSLQADQQDCAEDGDDAVSRLEASETLQTGQFSVLAEIRTLNQQLKLSALCPVRSATRAYCNWDKPPGLPGVRKLTVSLETDAAGSATRTYWLDP